MICLNCLQTHQRRRKNSSQGQGQSQIQANQSPLKNSTVPEQNNTSQTPADKQDTPSLVGTVSQSASLFKCQYCNHIFSHQDELFHHEEIHKKLGHIETANLAASQTILGNQTSCKFAGTANHGSHGNNAQDLKPLICHQCGLLCTTETAMIEHVKQHETLNRLYQNQQQQQQSQSHVANNSQQQQQQQQQQVSQVRNERSQPEGNNGITVSSPAVDNAAASTTATHNTPSSNVSVFPMPQISPGLPSMLDELCLAATTWNTFYTQQQQQQPNNIASTSVAVPQLPKALVAHNTINQNHISNGNSMVLAPGQQQQQQDVPPKPKKKKKKKKPKVALDDIFECNICHQTFATEFHRNIHANSHKYYDGSRGNKSPASSLSLVAAADIGNKATVPETTISTNVNITNTVVTNNVNTNSSTGISATNSNPATPHATVSVNTTNTSTTTCSYSNVTMVDTSGTYVPSSYGMTAAVAPSTVGMSSYGMTSVPNAFQTAASLPTMVPMAAPNQYPVTMAMAAPAPHPIFPLIHRPASNALSAPVAHHAVTQQPLFPQPLPQPVFPQR